MLLKLNYWLVDIIRKFRFEIFILSLIYDTSGVGKDSWRFNIGKEVLKLNVKLLASLQLRQASCLTNPPFPLVIWIFDCIYVILCCWKKCKLRRSFGKCKSYFWVLELLEYVFLVGCFQWKLKAEFVLAWILAHILWFSIVTDMKFFIDLVSSWQEEYSQFYSL